MVTEQLRPRAPYAPMANVRKTISRYRDRGLPDTITPEVLEQIGIPKGNAPRTLQALRFLGVIDDEGRRTELFERLRRATTDEYPSTLAEIVRSAYSPIFTIVDPAQDSDIAINDAFRQYEPAAQRQRMVALFLGLCREAGIVASEGSRRRPTSATRQRTQQRQRRQRGEQGANIEQPRPPVHDPPPDLPPDYRLISALVQQLPRDGRWPRDHRDRWMQAMQSAIDLLFEVSDD